MIRGSTSLRFRVGTPQDLANLIRQIQQTWEHVAAALNTYCVPVLTLAWDDEGYEARHMSTSS